MWPRSPASRPLPPSSAFWPSRRRPRARCRKAAAAAAKSRGKRQPLKKTKLLAPIQGSVAIYCAGANYADHAAAMAAREGSPPPVDPHERGAEALSLPQGAGHRQGPGDRSSFPLRQGHGLGNQIAGVMGRPAKDVPKEKALDYVAGYMVSNDLSARDRGRRDGVAPTSPFKMDWLKHKTFEGSCLIGPWIVPASDIPDPQNLGLKLWVNGELKQNSNTGKMLFTLAEQIEQLSINMTLHPGDLILTGTPSGTGAKSRNLSSRPATP